MRRRFFYLAVSSDLIGIPNNEIWYTSSNNNLILPYSTSEFNTYIISNSYSDGKGVIVFWDSVTSIGDYAFYHCTGLTSVTIPNSVTSIGDLAFEGCSGLTSVTIPNSVTSIGDLAFYDCSGLTSVTIGNSVESIGFFAFSGCTGLTSVTIPNSVTSIENMAFSSCTGLTSVTIPNSVTSIGDYAFIYCTGLTSVTCKAIIPPTIDSNTFNRVPTSIPIYVPAESVDAYKSAQYWSNFTNIQAIS